MKKLKAIVLAAVAVVDPGHEVSDGIGRTIAPTPAAAIVTTARRKEQREDGNRCEHPCSQSHVRRTLPVLDISTSMSR